MTLDRRSIRQFSVQDNRSILTVAEDPRNLSERKQTTNQTSRLPLSVAANTTATNLSEASGGLPVSPHNAEFCPCAPLRMDAPKRLLESESSRGGFVPLTSMTALYDGKGRALL